MDENKNFEQTTGVDESRYSMETRIIYGKNISKKWDYSHHVIAPVTSSVIFRLDSVERGAEGFIEFANPNFKHDENTPIYIYDRLGEPNKDILEENLAFIEKGETAVSFSSGMGAISAILSVLTNSGMEILSHKTLYGCTFSLLNNWFPKFNIKNTSVDFTDLDQVSKAITPNTRVLYFETPSNPSLDLIDIAKIKEISSKINENRDVQNKIFVVVDNTFATPYCQRPITFGADFVVHSLTKGIGGFGTDMGGVVIGPKEFKDLLLLFRKDFGAVLGTKSASTILTYGLPTLHLRIRRQIENAQKIANFLSSHPKVESVNYPGLKNYKHYELAKKQMVDFDGKFAPGSLIFFSLNGNSEKDKKDKGKWFMNYAAKNAYTMTLAVSLGHTRTLIEHPASMTHSVIPPDRLLEHGINPGGIRIACGIENVEDILFDLEKCLKIA